MLLKNSSRLVLAGLILLWSTNGFALTKTFTDEFNAVSYSNSNGATPWTTAWVETGDDGAPGSGTILVADNPNVGGTNLEARFQPGGGPDQLSRVVDLSGITAANLTFNYAFIGGIETCAQANSDILRVYYRNSSAGTFAQLGADICPGAVSGTFNMALPLGAGGTATSEIRIESEGFLGGDEFAFVDSVTVSGTGPDPLNVFRDYNSNGVLDSGETGIPGIVVTAFDDNGNTATTTTTATGQYSFSAGVGAPSPLAGTIRLEFSLPGDGSLDYLDPGPGGGTTVQFVSLANINSALVGFHVASEYCQSNPRYWVSCYTNGNPLHPSNAAEPAIVSLEYDDTGTNTSNNYFKTREVLQPTIGSVWGMAYDAQNRRMFSAAMLKRHAGVGPNGIGAIYVTNRDTGTTSLFHDFGAAAGTVQSNTARLTAGTNSTESRTGESLDAGVFDQIAKVGFGDIDLSADGSTLYVVNLFDRQVYGLSTTGAPSPAIVPGAPWIATSPGGGTGRPWALEVHQNQLYVGVVSDAAPLRAQVYRYDGTSWSTVFSPAIDLNYPRDLTAFTATAVDRWRSWFTVYDGSEFDQIIDGIADANGGNGQDLAVPQAILADLEITDAGLMTLGFVDRGGYQMGYASAEPDDTNALSVRVRYWPAGDILRATQAGSNFVIEDGTSGAGTNPFGPPAPNGGTEFFNDLSSAFPTGTYAQDQVNGGLMQRRGSDEVVMASSDQIRAFSGTTTAFSLSSGARVRETEVYQDGTFTDFVKSGGLGDLELACDAAPIQLGNRLWNDANFNGIQDPGESSLAGVTVTLHDMNNGGLQVGTAVTDVNGLYYFGGLTNQNMGATTQTVTVTRPIDRSTDDAQQFVTDGAMQIAATDIEVVDPAGTTDFLLGLRFNNLQIPQGATITSSYIQFQVDDTPANTAGSNVRIRAQNVDNAATFANTTNNISARTLTTQSVTNWSPAQWTTANQRGVAQRTPSLNAVVQAVVNRGGWAAGNSMAFVLDGTGEREAESFDGNPSGAASIVVTYQAPTPRTVLPNRNYEIRVATAQGPLTGLSLTQANAASASSIPDSVDSDAVLSGANAIISLTTGNAGSNDATHDFGFFSPVSIGSTVFLDADADGIQDAGESGISGVSVELFGAGPNGVIGGGDDVSIGTQVTNGQGEYFFNGLTPGNYFLQIASPPAAAQLSSPNTDTADNGQDGDDNGSQPGGAGTLVQSPVIALASGTEPLGNGATGAENASGGALDDAADANGDMTVDFGFVPNGTTIAINGIVFYDTNSDGDYDLAGGNSFVDEPLFPNVGVLLYDNIDCSGEEIAFTQTDVSGAYSFSGLTPGADYCVQVAVGTLPATGYASTTGGDQQGLPSIANGDGHDFGYDAAFCAPALDFETDAYNNPIGAGTIIDDEYIGYGITVTSFDQVNNPPMIFDTANPTGGDDDIGSPNETCPGGGPGMGIGGEVGQPGENCPAEPIGNVLIISEDADTSDPDDNGPGGTITFDFLNSIVVVTEMNFVDMGDNGTNAGDIDFFNNSATPFDVQPIPVFGDNSFGQLAINFDRVDRIDVNLFGSGSISDLIICQVQEVRSYIGDFVWLDIDADGVFDVGEPGIPNVELTLFDAGPDRVVGGGDDITLGTTLTDSNGLYLFDNVLATGPNGEPPQPIGYFYVQVTNNVPAGLQLSPGAVNPLPAARMELNDSNLTFDFPYSNADPNTGIIGDLVWADTNPGGVTGQRDPGEPGIGNVTLDLEDSSGAVIATTTTAPDGSYLFVGVPVGDYRVRVTDTNNALTGYTLTTGPQSNPNPSYPISLLPGDVYLAADFGYVPDNPGALFTITDRVWNDVNNDQLRNQFDIDGDLTNDTDEPWFEGVTVALENAAGNVIATAITDANGVFTFHGLPAAMDYQIVITDIDNVLQGYRSTTPFAAAGERGNLDLGPSIDNTSFGYRLTPRLGDRIWSDADGDGVQDPNEVGIPGVTVDLYLDEDRDGVLDPGEPLQGTRTTDVAGMYLFDNLLARHYIVVVSDTANVLSGFTQTGDPGESGTCVTCDGQGESLLGGARSDLTQDFGYRNPALANISGTVFEDLDRDGIDDGGSEPKFESVTLDLQVLDPGPDGICGNFDDVVLQSVATTTSATGDYLFADLPPNCYRVVVTDDAGILDNYELTSGLDAIPVSLGAVDVTDVDFGYVRESGTGSIGDFVWFDVDRDGIQDSGEPGIGSVRVDLYLLGNDGVIGGGDDVLLSSTVTDPQGRYTFPNLDANFYYVDVNPANPALQDLVLTGGTDPTGIIALSRGENYDRADFGYAPPATEGVIGDFVWADVDNDGIQDPGEVGIPGVTVYLRGADNGVNLTTVTDATGLYLFTGLAPEDYFAVVDTTTVPAAFLPTPTNTPNGDDTYGIGLGAGQSILTADFGFRPNGATLGTIGDFVWLDEDTDGLQDANEEGIRNVSLNLVGPGVNGMFGDADDEVLATTTTGFLGEYQFTGLLPGNYQVQVTDVLGVLDGLNLSSPPVGTIALSAGQNFLTADFGYAPSTGLGSIGNLVFFDFPDAMGNYDGVFERTAGDSGIQGVELELWLDRNGNGMIDNDGTDNLLRRTVTNANGEYDFTGLPAENYLVRIIDRNGVLNGFQPTVNGTPNTDDNSQALPFAVALPGLGEIAYADFGYRADSPTVLNISGTVFEDDSGAPATDNNGVFNPPGEPTVDGANVTLYRDVNGNGIIDPNDTIFRTQRTAADGFFLFTGLPPNTNWIIGTSVSGTSVNGYTQTTQQTPVASFPQSGVQPVMLLMVDSTDNDFGYYNGGIVTTPVTLASFAAMPSGVGVEFRWTTATETSNVGFLLFAETAEGELVAVGDVTPQPAGQVFRNGFESGATAKSTAAAENRNLIASATGDAVTPQRYSYFDDDQRVRSAAQYWLVDVDVRANRTWHGPFVLGRAEGREVELQAPDWNGIRASVTNNRAQRNANRRGAEDVRIEVRQTGIQRITFEDLVGIESNLANAPLSQLRLLRNGTPVAFSHNASRSNLESGAYIEFYGVAADTLYTGTNVYVLTARAGAPSTLAEHRDAAVTQVVDAWHLETVEVAERRAYSQTGFDGDPWYMDRMLAFGSDREVQYTLNLDRARGGQARVLTNFWTVTDFPGVIDHHVRLSMNDVVVYDNDQLDGAASVTVDRVLDGNDWHEGANTLRLEVLTKPNVTYSLVNSNAFAIEYPRDLIARSGALDFTVQGNFQRGDGFRVYGLNTQDVVAYGIDGDRLIRYDVTPQPWSAGLDRGYSVDLPSEVQSGHYIVMDSSAVIRPRIEPMVPTSLLDEAADYIMISHPDFIAGLQPLVDYHEANGLSVRVVDVDAVYQQYSGGNFDPAAIDAFIEDAFYQLQTNYVLLVGGDTYDYRNDLGVNAISFLPSMYRATDPLIRFTPTDAQYADVNGDDLPDLAIGRFPVRTATELNAVVAKTIRYATQNQGATALFASDARGTDANFLAESRNLEVQLGTDWRVTNAAIDEVGAAAARTLIQQTLEGDGVALTSFFGHSGPTTWSFNGLFSATDAANLTNFDQPTVVTQWGCWNTYFVSPNFNTMAHRFMVSGEQGAAAVLGAATLTTVQSDRDFGELLVQAMTAPGVRIGDALMDAKNALGGNPAAYTDVIIGFNLLGDPAISIRPVE